MIRTEYYVLYMLAATIPNYRYRTGSGTVCSVSSMRTPVETIAAAQSINSTIAQTNMKNLLPVAFLSFVNYTNGFIQPLLISRPSFARPFASNPGLRSSSSGSEFDYALIFDCDGK